MINHDQAIFDAIAAATDHNDDGIFVDVQKFINTFNNHRDRKLCTSLNVAQAPDDTTKTVYVKRWRTLVKLPTKYADEIVEALRVPGVAQTPPDQFMDDYKRDTTNAMAARILELEALLSAAQTPPKKD